MSTVHPLVEQLRFTRREFLRGLRGVSDEEGAKRVGRMNCLAWNVGHLAWQEQRYFLTIGQERTPWPEAAQTYAIGALATTPSLRETLALWRKVTAAADPWLDSLTADDLAAFPEWHGRTLTTSLGNRLQRTIYHYWYHNGENQAIRQTLGHPRLAQFVGNIDAEAPFRTE